MMRYLIFSILFFNLSCTTTSPEFSNYYRVAGMANKQIRQEFLLVDNGAGAMIPDKIHAYSSMFYHSSPIPISQGRYYVLRMVQIILNKFNNDIPIQEYLEKMPFTEKNVCFTIFINNWDEFQPPENCASVIAFSFGKISYKRFDPVNDVLNLLFSETYEEALEKCPSFKQSTKQ